MIRALLISLVLTGCATTQGRDAPAGPTARVTWNQASGGRAGDACAIDAPPPRSERDVQRFAALGRGLERCLERSFR